MLSLSVLAASADSLLARDRFTDPQTGVALGLNLGRNVRSKCRCSMCPAIHITSRSWLRSSSTHEPSDPPLGVVFLFACVHEERDGSLPMSGLHSISQFCFLFSHKKDGEVVGATDQGSGLSSTPLVSSLSLRPDQSCRAGCSHHSRSTSTQSQGMHDKQFRTGQATTGHVTQSTNSQSKQTQCVKASRDPPLVQDR
jgi:hypothetical protein